MSQKPIIFSTEMVKAILSGQKTQTRRIIKNQFLPGAPKSFNAYRLENGKYGFENDDSEWICPYGGLKDKLYVRETTLFWRNASDNSISSVKTYKADGYSLKDGERWTPSIHVPKKYARLLLEIESIRVERLQEISEDDAKKEGVVPNCAQAMFSGGKWILDPQYKPCPHCEKQCLNEWVKYPIEKHEDEFPFETAKESFQSLWDSINKDRGFGWDLNPWVWVIEFKKIDVKWGGK